MRVRVDARAGESIGSGMGTQCSCRPRQIGHDSGRTARYPHTRDEAGRHSSQDSRTPVRPQHKREHMRSIHSSTDVLEPCGVWSARRARGEGQRGAWPERPQAASLVVGRNRAECITHGARRSDGDVRRRRASSRAPTVWGAARCIRRVSFLFFSLGAHAPLARHHLTTAGRH